MTDAELLRIEALKLAISLRDASTGEIEVEDVLADAVALEGFVKKANTTTHVAPTQTFVFSADGGSMY